MINSDLHVQVSKYVALNQAAGFLIFDSLLYIMGFVYYKENNLIDDHDLIVLNES